LSLHQPLLQTLRSFRHRHASRRARSRARRPLLEGLEQRTLLTIDFLPVSGAESVIDFSRFTGGLKLDSPDVYFLFWGSYWGKGTGPNQENQIIQAERQFISSSYFSGLTQYGVDGKVFFGGSANDNSDPAAGFSDGSLQGVIDKAMLSREFPFPWSLQDNPIYMVITPPGVSSYEGTGVGGYHSDTTFFVSPLIYGYAGAGGPSSFSRDAYTVVLSHEITEAITDPIPNTGIFVAPGSNFPNPTPNSNEVCDYEAQNHRYRLGGPGGVQVQSYSSQRDQAFIIPDGSSQTLSVTNSDYVTVWADQAGRSSNSVGIGVVNNGLQVTLDYKTFWFDPGTITGVGVDVSFGSASDSVDVEQTLPNAPVSIVPLGGATRVSLCANSENLDGLQSSVTIVFNSFGSSPTNVTVNDQANTHDTSWNVQQSGNSVRSSLSRSHAAPIYFDWFPGAKSSSLTIDGGSGTNQYTIDDLPGAIPTQVNTGNGTNYIWVDDSAGGLGINTGFGTNYVDIDGPAGGDAGYLDGNVTVFGGFGGTTNVWILDWNNTTPSTWYYKTGAVTDGLFSYDSSIYWRSGSSYTITLSNVSSTDFWGSSTDTLIHWYLHFGLAGTASPGTISGPTGGMGPLPPAGQAGDGRDPLIAGATDSNSGILYDLALELILADSPSSERPRSFAFGCSTWPGPPE
jgi:hypothetical protein